MNCELCGRPALALVKTGKKRSRKARAGQPRKLPQHSLCGECFEKQSDSLRTSKAMDSLMGATIEAWKTADELERELRDEEESRLKGIIAKALKSIEEKRYYEAWKALKEAA